MSAYYLQFVTFFAVCGLAFVFHHERNSGTFIPKKIKFLLKNVVTEVSTWLDRISTANIEKEGSGSETAASRKEVNGVDKEPSYYGTSKVPRLIHPESVSNQHKAK